MNRFKEIKGKKGHATYKNQNKFLYSFYDPYAEAEKFIKSQQPLKQNIITICGANYINQALQTLPNKLIFSYSTDIFPNLTEKVQYKHSTNQDIFIEIINAHKLKAENTSIIVWQPYFECDYQTNMSLLEKIKNVLIKNSLQIINETSFKNLEEKNAQQNIKAVSKIKFIEKKELAYPPALVISSGNSLLCYEEFIKKVQDRFIIFSYPSAIKFLSHINVTPDFIVSVDPGYAAIYHLYPLPNCKIITTLASAPSVIRNFHSNCLFFNYNTHTENTIYKNTNCLTSPPNGTVAITTLDIISQLGFKTTLLLAQDFGMYQKKLHISGGNFENFFLEYSNYYTSYEKQILTHESSLILTTTQINNQKIPTTTSLNLYYEHFRNTITANQIVLLSAPFNPIDKKFTQKPMDFFYNFPIIDKQKEYLPTRELILND